MKPKQKEYLREQTSKVSGERHLGVVAGNDEYRMEYCRKMVEWITEIKLLAEIAITHPQAACACYVGK